MYFHHIYSKAFTKYLSANFQNSNERLGPKNKIDSDFIDRFMQDLEGLRTLMFASQKSGSPAKLENDSSDLFDHLQSFVKRHLNNLESEVFSFGPMYY